MVALEVGVDTSKLITGSQEGTRSLLLMTRSVQQLLDATNQAGGVLGQFLGRANPYLMAGVLAMNALSLATKAFKTEAVEAAKGWDTFRESMQKALQARQTGSAFGLGPTSGIEAEQKAATDIYSQVNGPISIDQLAAKMGIGDKGTGAYGELSDFVRNRYVGEQPFRALLDRIGQGPGGLKRAQDAYGNNIDSINSGTFPMQQQDVRDFLVSHYQVLDRERSSYQNRGRLPDDANEAGWRGLHGANGPPAPDDWKPGAFGGIGPTASDEDIRFGVEVTRAREEREREALAEHKREMQEIANIAGQVGSRLGDGIFDALNKTQTLRQAMAGVLQDLERMGLREAVGGIFRTAVSSFGTTGPQAVG